MHHNNKVTPIYYLTLKMATPEEEAVRVCPKCHDIPSLPFILKSFSLNSTDVCNVYAVGSHVWGTCTRHSDWDLVIVTSSQHTHPQAINAHKNKLDAWILSVDEYMTNIKDHLLQALITVWLPRCFVLKERYDPRISFKYSQSSLLGSVKKMNERDLRVAKKHFTKNDPQGGSKILRHCIKQMELAIQIHHEGYIIDYTITSEEEKNLRERGFEGIKISWDEAIVLIKTRMDIILSELDRN